MLNKITIMGRLAKDPELRRTNSGTAVANFTIAVDRDFGDKQADFFSVVAWKGTGEFVAKNFAKGRPILISGRLETQKWEGNDGTKYTVTKIIAENVYFCDSKPMPAPQPYTAPAPQPYTAPVANQYEGFEEISEDDEDLPF